MVIRPSLRSCLSEVQCVLLGDMLVLLQKQDDKMVLKCQSKSNIAVQEGKQMLSPIIKLDSVFLREVATGSRHITVQELNRSNTGNFHFGITVTYLCNCWFAYVLPDRKAFYVIFTWDSGAQIYELVAQSVGEMKT